MCGRFALLTDLSVVIASFDVREVACEYRPGSGITPGRQVAAVIHDGGNRLVGLQWGLVPAWVRNPSIGKRLFNARAETVAEKPSFRNAFRKGRCLIVADGFYEWRKEGKTKKPFYFHLKSGRPFGFAGLYERWESPDHQPVMTCAIITTEPNALIEPIHDRMPVIMPKEREGFWLDTENQNRIALLSLLRPYPSGEMDMSGVPIPLPGAPGREDG
jgi:putative SOS response-associated peptidase YedK